MTQCCELETAEIKSGVTKAGKFESYRVTIHNDTNATLCTIQTFQTFTALWIVTSIRYYHSCSKGSKAIKDLHLVVQRQRKARERGVLSSRGGYPRGALSPPMELQHRYTE
jgi:hypothetical protein